MVPPPAKCLLLLPMARSSRPQVGGDHACRFYGRWAVFTWGVPWGCWQLVARLLFSKGTEGVRSVALGTGPWLGPRLLSKGPWHIGPLRASPPRCPGACRRDPHGLALSSEFCG